MVVLLDSMTELESEMKKLFPFFLVLIAGCSSDPVNMDEVLFERAGQYITDNNYSSFFFFNLKVYNGPAYTLHKNGKKKEEGKLKNGFQSGLWTAWDDEGNKWFSGAYEHGKEHGKWVGWHPNGNKKYEGIYENGFQAGKWTYYNEAGKKNLEEIYFFCTEECADSHYKMDCSRMGKVKESKKF